MMVKAIIERWGFRFLGEVVAGQTGGVQFPEPPDSGGLYFITFQSGGHYVGETGRYGRSGGKPGRFHHYASPADDIWTELVINAMLQAGNGGRIHIREEPGANKSQRRRLEAEVIRSLVAQGIPLWNKGSGRCEKTYLAWKIPIIEKMLASANARYADREVLKPYSIDRLRRLPLELEKSLAEARRLGLDLPTHTASACPVESLTGTLSKKYAIGVSRAIPVVSSHAQRSSVRAPPVSSTASRPGGIERPTQQAVAHCFLAANPDSSWEEMICANPGTFNKSTAQTLWRDFRMTLKAMASGTYHLGENETLTIRRVTCRLWDIHPNAVTKSMVEEELVRQGHQRSSETIASIVGNTISTLQAFSALR